MISQRFCQSANSFLRFFEVAAKGAVKCIIQPSAGFGDVGLVTCEDASGVLISERNRF